VSPPSEKNVICWLACMPWDCSTSKSQRLALPLAWVRADPADPRSSTHERLLVRAAVAQCAEDDALVLDAGFGLALLQEEGATRFVVRCAKNSTFRRAQPPAYGGRGRIPTRGVLVRPLARTFKGTLLPATPPNRAETWQDAGVTLRAEIWDDLVLCDAAADSPSFTVIAVHDPRYREPLLLASPLAVSAQTLHALYHDRWAVEQLPLAAKQMRERGPRVRPCAGNLPATVRPGPPRRRDSLLCCGEQPAHPHRLLGSPAAAHAGPPASGPRTLSFSARCPASSTHSHQSGRHSPSAHGVLGATTPLCPCAREHPRSATVPTPSEGRLSYRKLKILAICSTPPVI